MDILNILLLSTPFFFDSDFVVDTPGLEYTATGRVQYTDEGSLHYTAPAEDA
jgi:hypothetical protein